MMDTNLWPARQHTVHDKSTYRQPKLACKHTQNLIQVIMRHSGRQRAPQWISVGR
jgi:hypothetical protein